MQINYYEILDKYTSNLRLLQEQATKGSDNNFHLVYCLINKSNKKFYIGKHSTSNLDDNYLGSGYHIKNSVLKYGEDNFIKFVIKFFDSSIEAYAYEKELISIKMIESKECFNWKGGGEGFGEYETNPAVISSKNGTNPWIGKNNPTYKFTSEIREKIQNHPKVIQNQTRWKLNNPSVERIKNGTHKFIGSTNPNKVAPWKQGSVKGTSILAWSMADELHKLYKDNGNCGAKKLHKVALGKFDLDPKIFKISSLITIVKKFNNKWEPTTDIEWQEFKKTYTQ